LTGICTATAKVTPLPSELTLARRGARARDGGGDAGGRGARGAQGAGIRDCSQLGQMSVIAVFVS